MSTKIYNGFILRDTTLETALNRIQVFRTQVEDLAKIRMARHMAKEISTRLDRYAARDLFSPGSKIPALKSPMGTVWMEILDDSRKAEAEHRRHPASDFQFQMTLHPDGGDVLGISFVEERSWHKAWLASPGVEDYSYWNNTDQPEDLSEMEWEARAQRWTLVLGRDRSSRPGFAGLTADIHETTPPLADVEDVQEQLPGIEDRISKLAFEIMHSRRIAEMHSEASEPPAISAITRVLYDLQDHIKTEEGGAERGGIAEQLALRLTRTLSKDILLNGIEA